MRLCKKHESALMIQDVFDDLPVPSRGLCSLEKRKKGIYARMWHFSLQRLDALANHRRSPLTGYRE